MLVRHGDVGTGVVGRQGKRERGSRLAANCARVSPPRTARARHRLAPRTAGRIPRHRIGLAITGEGIRLTAAHGTRAAKDRERQGTRTGGTGRAPKEGPHSADTAAAAATIKASDETREPALQGGGRG